ncbi:MAG: class I SAM-dependent RNA methyltransferase [Desulfobacterales bacterium]|uniref:Class I SAM-dependent RNA methyltransferase n=1 Tax=Candidatus Desulfatibia profunda TaxID=2841695 RepID=A0A8J6NTW9_9BACT|nr:class I SAM-dependent RNA methyltransferase [Candidatus Desulfatibia profunda]MBL7179706.1 class I SAM-dependent RNA methyltransferase [Desulfobacterales bacterium]
MFKYQKTNRYFAQLPGGFETLAAAELEDLGASRLEPGFRGIHFSADHAALYAINYKARMITRVLAPLISFQCRDRDDLYRAGRSIDWTIFFALKHTFGIFANVADNANIRHSKFAALCLKDAVADFFRQRLGERPNVDPTNPDIWLNLYIERNKGTISLDTSGGSLHRRGYRHKTVEAPMQETVAAAMVELSGWNGEKPIYDPMCGCGMLLCEALMKYCRLPAGFLKQNFGFRFLPDFDNNLWESVKIKADENIRQLPDGLIAGSDIADIAVESAGINCRALPGGDRIELSRKDFKDISGLENRVIVCNPPYGIRLKPADDLGEFYRNFGDFLKQRCRGSQAYIYFGNREMLKKIGLKPAWKKPLKNAGLDGRVAKYELY